MNPPVTLPIEIHDCWNRIGVWGRETPRCPKLETVVHCRNCEVYAESGRRILERALPESYQQEWRTVLSQEKHQRQRDTRTMVVFRLGDEWMGLPADLFSEVTEMRPIHRLPHRSNNMLLGLVNIRGELKLCVSLGKLLNLDKGGKLDKGNKVRHYQRLVVIGKDSEQFVFPVSEVLGIERFNDSDLHAAPASVTLAKSTYTRGMLEVGDKRIACLDHELLLYTLVKRLQDG
jgi:chemotaxis-related protein WspD